MSFKYSTEPAPSTSIMPQAGNTPLQQTPRITAQWLSPPGKKIRARYLSDYGRSLFHPKGAEKRGKGSDLCVEVSVG